MDKKQNQQKQTNSTVKRPTLPLLNLSGVQRIPTKEELASLERLKQVEDYYKREKQLENSKAEKTQGSTQKRVKISDEAPQVRTYDNTDNT